MPAPAWMFAAAVAGINGVVTGHPIGPKPVVFPFMLTAPHPK